MLSRSLASASSRACDDCRSSRTDRAASASTMQEPAMVTEEANTWVLSAVAVRTASRRSSSVRMSRPIRAIASRASDDVPLRRMSMLVATSLFLTRSMLSANSANRCSTAALSFAALAT